MTIGNSLDLRGTRCVEIGNKIRIQRENFDMSRGTLSEVINLSPYFLGQIERGQRKMSINTLIKISECLPISIDYLIFEEQKRQSRPFQTFNYY